MYYLFEEADPLQAYLYRWPVGWGERAHYGTRAGKMGNFNWIFPQKSGTKFQSIQFRYEYIWLFGLTKESFQENVFLLCFCDVGNLVKIQFYMPINKLLIKLDVIRGLISLSQTVKCGGG